MPCIVDSDKNKTHTTSKDSNKEINGGGNLKMNTIADENCATNTNGDAHVVENGMKIEESHVTNGSEDAVTKESEKLETGEMKTEELKQDEEGKTKKKEDGDKSENPEGKILRTRSSMKSTKVCRGKMGRQGVRYGQC